MGTEAPSINGKGRILHAVDADLPLIAAKAAVELDMLAAERPTDMASVQILIEMLQNSVVYEEAAPKSFLDASTVTLMNYAITSSNWSTAPTTVSDVACQAAKIAETLNKAVQEKGPKAVIAKLRNFCIALSRCASSYRHSVFSSRPRHPFRR